LAAAGLRDVDPHRRRADLPGRRAELAEREVSVTRLRLSDEPHGNAQGLAAALDRRRIRHRHEVAGMPVMRSLKIKAQVLCGGDFAMGPGKADLMEAIERDGSISAAGRVLGMSYRRAWMLVDTMNRCWTEPLVETTPGGGETKGARLTNFGREVLGAYRSL